MAQIAIRRSELGLGRTLAAFVLVGAGLLAGLGIGHFVPAVTPQAAAPAGAAFSAAAARSALEAQRAAERDSLGSTSIGITSSNPAGFSVDADWAAYRTGERSR